LEDQTFKKNDFFWGEKDGSFYDSNIFKDYKDNALSIWLGLKWIVTLLFNVLTCIFTSLLVE